MFVLAAALLGLIVLLATLQYRWLGQISAAERERMQANLSVRTNAFALDFDRELTRAYLTFQVDPLQDTDNLAARVAERHDRWLATSRFPKLLKDVYVIPRGEEAAAALQRFDPATRFLEPVSWPAGFEPIRDHLLQPPAPPAVPSTVFVRTMPVIWEGVPALVVPTPVIMVNASDQPQRPGITDVKVTSAMRYTILALDREYLLDEMLPALARQHFRGGGDEAIDYELAVVSNTDKGIVFSTSPWFMREAASGADASAEFFHVRPQEFGAMVSEVRRFTSMISQIRGDGVAERRAGRGAGTETQTEVRRQLMLPSDAPGGTVTFRDTPSVSLLLQHEKGQMSPADRRAVEGSLAAVTAARPAAAAPRWRLVVKHPSGSLETAVANARRRNLLVSSGILAVLGVSIGFLVVSTRRAQDLARQQMEFVAAVSHELRTPLAVIRSAADNLAEGVVHEDPQVRKYGDLVRGEGRRLSEMVEQILELSGIHSGQRGFALRPVSILPLVHDVVRSSAPLIDEAGLHVEFDIPETLPPVLGDEQALRRVVQNLVGNAIKYGAGGGWIGVRGRTKGREVQLTVADRGIGIAPADQPHIFEPFYRAPGVIEAQIQGAGLGLSLVHRIVEAHGGRISVRSAPGEGSEFTVHLPAASEEPLARTSAAVDPAHRLS